MRTRADLFVVVMMTVTTVPAAPAAAAITVIVKMNVIVVVVSPFLRKIGHNCPLLGISGLAGSNRIVSGQR